VDSHELERSDCARFEAVMVAWLNIQAWFCWTG